MNRCWDAVGKLLVGGWPKIESVVFASVVVTFISIARNSFSKLPLLISSC